MVSATASNLISTMQSKFVGGKTYYIIRRLAAFRASRRCDEKRSNIRLLYGIESFVCQASFHCFAQTPEKPGPKRMCASAGRAISEILSQDTCVVRISRVMTNG